MIRYRILFALLAFILAANLSAQEKSAQLSPAARWAATVNEQYLIFPDVTYGVANNYTLKLDIWQHKGDKAPAPTVIYYHGGGWVWGDRTGATLFFLPYLELGWNVVNVDYRLADVSLAPAAVEDCRCALRWVIANAKKYNIDTNGIILTGHSAGGHLALITGMLPSSAGLDNRCGEPEELKVAAIVNWFGISDVADLLGGPNQKNYALMWMGSQPDAMTIAKRVSPLTYVRRGLPPVISIHGDADPVVPYAQAVQLHKALSEAGVPNELVTIHGGSHGQFDAQEDEHAYERIRIFLKQHGLLR
jgi:acetyl esterase/lipase